jgi:hypothetical protein
MSDVQIIGLISVLLCLILAWQGFRAQRMATNSALRMGLIWLAIFVGGVAVVSLVQG